MKNLTFAEMAEILTPETLPDFFHRLRNRPEPHSLEYEALLIKEAAETLSLSPWELFQKYQETSGEILPALTEKVWRLSFPAFFHCLEAKPEPKKCTIIVFPVNRIRKKTHIMEKVNNIHQLHTQGTNNV